MTPLGLNHLILEPLEADLVRGSLAYLLGVTARPEVTARAAARPIERATYSAAATFWTNLELSARGNPGKLEIGLQDSDPVLAALRAYFTYGPRPLFPVHPRVLFPLARRLQRQRRRYLEIVLADAARPVSTWPPTEILE